MEIVSVVTPGAGVLLVVLHITVGCRGQRHFQATVMHRIVHGNTDFACPLTAGDDIACYKLVSVKSRLRDLPGDPGYHD